MLSYIMSPVEDRIKEGVIVKKHKTLELDNMDLMLALSMISYATVGKLSNFCAPVSHL